MKDTLKSILLAFLLIVQGYPLCYAQQTAQAPAQPPAQQPAPQTTQTSGQNSAPAPAIPPGTSQAVLVLQEGTDVPLVFDQDISSKTAAEGDPVAFVLTDDIKVGNVVVAKAGSKALGEVTRAEKSGMMGKAGELSIRLDYLKVGDVKVKLRGTKGKEGESGTTSAVVLTVLFGPIGLIKHGKNIEIKKGASLKAYVGDDVSLRPAV
ncbi:MAG TPA: hypothetical protein VGT08_00705 [Terracidiphilus sp.]|nr:hypothetical protein [Terracidiphilus sp.]